MVRYNGQIFTLRSKEYSQDLCIITPAILAINYIASKVNFYKKKKKKKAVVPVVAVVHVVPVVPVVPACSTCSTCSSCSTCM